MKHKLIRYTLLVCLAIAAYGRADDAESLPPGIILAPAKLAEQIKAGMAPPIVYAGFPILYKGAHLPHAVFAGPCSKQEGLDLLLQATRNLSKDAEIVVYCGCCPFVRCPNIRPAFRALKEAGFTNIRVLELDTNLHTDWVEKGYPTEAK